MKRSLSSSPVRVPITYNKLLDQQFFQATQQLEKEKRLASFLDEQISLIESQFKHSSSPSNPSSLARAVSKLEEQLQHQMKSLNSLKDSNQVIRNEITQQRLDYRSLKASIEQAEKQQTHSLKRIRRTHSRAAYDQKLAGKYQESFRRNKSFFLQTPMPAPASRLHKTRMPTSLGHLPVLAPIDSDKVITTVLKDLKTRWIQRTAAVKTSLVEYIERIHSIREAFQQIELLSGSGVLEEIVTSLIKSQDQQYEVLAYINKLNSETEEVEDSLKKSHSRLQLSAHIDTTSNENTQEELSKIKGRIGKINALLSRNTQSLQSTIPIVTQLLDLEQTVFAIPPSQQTLDPTLDYEACLAQIEHFGNQAKLITTYLDTKKFLVDHVRPKAVLNKAKLHLPEVSD